MECSGSGTVSSHYGNNDLLCCHYVDLVMVHGPSHRISNTLIDLIGGQPTIEVLFDPLISNQTKNTDKLRERSTMLRKHIRSTVQRAALCTRVHLSRWFLTD